MIGKTALIINAHSGKNERQRKKLIACAAKHNLPYSLTHNLDDLQRALETYAMLNVQTLIIYGGDGTVDAVVTLMRAYKIFDQEPVLALLPGGTTNMTIRDCSLTGNVLRSFENILKPESTTKIIERSPIKVTAQSRPDEAAYGFFFGSGAIPRVIFHARDKLHTRGMTGSFSEFFLLIRVLKKLFKYDAEKDPLLTPSTIIVNGEQHHNVYALATTLHKLVLGLNPAAPENKIGFAALEHPYKNLWRNKSGLLDGQKSVEDGCGIIRKNARTFKISINGPWTLDGEMYEARDEVLTLSLEPPLRFVQG